MHQVLILIDPADEARTHSAVAEAALLHHQQAVHVQLLRVVPRLNSHVALCFAHGEAQRLQHQSGAEDLRFAQVLLETAGVPFTGHVRVGRSAETIAAMARALHCDRIVFGSRGTGLATRVSGSLAQQVRHLLGPGGVQVIGS